MRIIFVRHGEPNYELDCLTENGKVQAEAAARRLRREGISKIYSSPYGRARETAEYTSRLLGLPVEILDYMHEITWGGEGLPEGGHPWKLSDRLLIEENADYYKQDWMEHPYFKTNAFTANYREIIEKFDDLLAGMGYRHEGRHFLCTAQNDSTVAVFSHGGSGASVISHLLALPFPFMATAMTFDYTSVSILSFESAPGRYVFPRLELFNDAAHIRPAAGRPAIQQQTDR